MICDRCKSEMFLKPTPRQLSIVKLLAQGHSTKEVANELGITFSTVLTQKYRLRRRVGLKTDMQLVAWAIVEGLIDKELILGKQ